MVGNECFVYKHDVNERVILQWHKYLIKIWGNLMVDNNENHNKKKSFIVIYHIIFTIEFQKGMIYF
jgi:hypothetical protein